MATQTKEVVLDTNCPLCYDEGKENPLRNTAGTFGSYCIGADGASRPHFYEDTGTLRILIAGMDKKRKLAAKRAAPPQAEAAAPAAEAEAPISTVETKAFEVTEMDAGRLSELLAQPIPDAGTLVGAVWSLKNNAAQSLTEETRTAAATAPGLVEIPQLADGGLALQVFFPWALGWKLAEKAQFNSISATQYAQNLFEYIASGNYFPTTDIPEYPPINVRQEGYWLLINVPELYVGSMLERADTLGMTPQMYVQNYFRWMVDQELFP